MNNFFTTTKNRIGAKLKLVLQSFSQITGRLSGFFLFLSEKKWWHIIIESIMLIWVIVIAIIYFYAHRYLWLAGGTFLLLILFYLGKHFFPKYYQTLLGKLKQKIANKESLTLPIAHIIIAFPLLTIITANLILFVQILLNNQFRRINIITAEINIIYKIILCYLFWLVFIILVSAIGKKIQKVIKLESPTGLTGVLFNLGIGLAPVIFCTFILSLLGWFYAWAIGLVLILFLASSFSEIKNTFVHIFTKKILLANQNTFQTIQNIIFAGLFLVTSVLFITSLKPYPTDTDSLHTYYNVANLVAQSHHYHVWAHFTDSNMAHNTEMIYATIISLVGPLFLAHFSLIFFLGTIILLYLLLKKLFTEKYALWGLISVTFLPWNFIYLAENKVEIILAFYSCLMLTSFFIWLENKDKYSYLFYLGIFSGLSLGIKYNALLFILPIYLALIWLLFKNKFCFWKQLLISCFLAILFFSPWAIKNQMYFKNILYPFQYYTNNSISLNDLSNNNFYQKERTKEVDYLRQGVNNNRWSITSLLATIFNQSTGFKNQAQDYLNYGFILLIIIPFYFIYWPKNKEYKFLLFLSCAYLLLWYFLGSQRPWYGFWGFYLAAALLPQLLLKSQALRLIFIIYIITVAISCPLKQAFTQSPFTINNFHYLFGQYNKEQFLQADVDYYQTAQKINTLNLQPGEKILLTNDFRTAFINNNDDLIITDIYLFKSGYLLSQGQGYFYQALKQAKIKYILNSIFLEKSAQDLIDFKNISQTDYLHNYRGKIPSIYIDQAKLQKFLAEKTIKVFSDDYNYYTLYKIQ